MALDVRKQKTQSYLKEHEMVRAKMMASIIHPVTSTSNRSISWLE
jgi:hypothetical protein